MHRTIRTAFATAAACAALTGLTASGGAEQREPADPSTTSYSAPAVVPLAPLVPGRPIGAPTRVRIPAIDVTERLHGVGLRADGAMQTPDFGEAGWYDRGPRPGAPGPAVIVAHVHGPGGDDVFARLHELRVGDRVTVDHAGGSSTFAVSRVERTPKDSLPYDRIWVDTDRPVLRLITCGGTPDPATRMYPDNTIVYAAPVP